LLCYSISIYLIVKNKDSPGLELALDNPPKPHAFTSLPLESRFSMHEFIIKLRFVFSRESIKTLTSIVFTKTFFYYCCKKFLQ